MTSSVGLRFFAACALAAAAGLGGGCSDDPRQGAPDAGGTAGGLAVINADYMAAASSLSVLSSAGDVVHPDCVDSATGGSGTGSNTLSSDVTLPSQPQRGGGIVVIDRGNTALTFVNPATCAVDRQVSVAGGFARANPHDVVILDDGKAYVTRYEKNLTATTPAASGDDVLIIDPRDGTALGNIDLSTYAAQVAGSGVTVQARPDRAVLAGGKVAVTLNNQDAAFAVFGEGRLVIIDPATDTVAQSLPLTGLTNCEAMTVVAGTATLLVSCGGAYTDADPASASGIAVVDMSTAPATLVTTITGTALGDQPVNFQWVAGAAAGGTTRVVLSLFGAAAFGTAPEIPDAVLAVDLGTGAATSVTTAAAYAIGRGTLSGTELLIPDATAAAPKIHVFDVAAVPTETGAFVADSVLNLGPREVARY